MRKMNNETRAFQELWVYRKVFRRYFKRTGRSLFLGIRFFGEFCRFYRVFPSRWDIISLTQKSIFRRWLTLAHLQNHCGSLKSNIAMVTKFPVLQQLHFG